MEGERCHRTNCHYALATVFSYFVFLTKLTPGPTLGLLSSSLSLNGSVGTLGTADGSQCQISKSVRNARLLYREGESPGFEFCHQQVNCGFCFWYCFYF